MENQRVRLARDHRALVYGIGFAFLALAIVVILHFELRQYIDLYLNELYARKTKVPAVGDFGSAGEYFNIVIGVPLALLGVLIAVAASIILAQFTLTKDDIAIFTFVEKLMRPVSERIKGLVESFTKLVGVGEECTELVERVHQTINAQESSCHTSSIDIIECLSPAQRDEFLHEMRAHLDSIAAYIEEFECQYKQLLGTMYGSLFAREKIQDALDTEPWGTVNSYLRTTLPPSILRQAGLVEDVEEQRIPNTRRERTQRAKTNARNPREYSNDVRRMFSCLTTYDIKTEEALQLFSIAACLLPDKSTTIEFVGLAIYPLVFMLEKPQRRFLHDKTIHGYLVNMGAAQLVTLYQYIPNRSAIKSALNMIFEHRSKAAQKFLTLAAPTPRDFTSFEQDDSICWQFDHPERMIVVLVDKGNGVIFGETYNRSHHGEIPATGYKS